MQNFVATTLPADVYGQFDELMKAKKRWLSKAECLREVITKGLQKMKEEEGRFIR